MEKLNKWSASHVPPPPPPPPVNRSLLPNKYSSPELNQNIHQWLQEDRVRAGLVFNRRGVLLQQSVKAFNRGDKYLAAELAGEAKALRTQAARLDEKAAQRIFSYYNPSLETGVVDLHGLRTDEALYYLGAHIQRCIGRDEMMLTCIVGRGNNSSMNGPRLLPAVLNFCRQLDLPCEFERESEGKNGEFSGVVHIRLVK